MDNKKEQAKRLFQETAKFCELLKLLNKSHGRLTKTLDRFYELDPNFLTELSTDSPFELEPDETMRYFILHVYGNTFRAHSEMPLTALVEQLFIQNYLPGNPVGEGGK